MSFIGNRPDSYGYSSTTYEHFSGDSSNTSFSLSRAVSSNSDVQVVVNNVIQDPGVSYYISNLYTLTFYSAPSTGTDNIYVVYRNFINTGIGLGANSVSSEVIRPRAINTSHLGDITEINSGVGNSLTLKSNNITSVSIDDSGDVTILGNLSVEGSTTTINTETLIIEDKNIVLGNVASPTNVTADGAGISVLGDTDKTFNWVSANSSWESSENLNLVSGKSYKIGNTAVLSSTALGSGVISSSLTSLGTLGSLAVSGNSLLSNVEYIGNLTGGTGVVSIGSGQIFKDANGRVGIGTNSPVQKLEIRGNGGGDTVTLQLTNDGSHPARLRLHSGHGNWSVGNSITVGDALEFRDESSSLTRMLINSSGNVGIGTTSPGFALEVHKQITIKGNNPSTNAEYQDWPDCSFNIRRSDDYSQNGITMASFGYRSDGTYFTDNSVCNIRIRDQGQPASCATSSSTTKLTLGSPGTFSIITGNSSEKLFINSAGDVGIGATSPDTKLHVYSTGNANDAHGLIKAEASTAANAVNASFTTKNWSGTSQFMQWENYGLRIGSRILTNYGQGNIYFTTGSDSIKATLYDNGGHFSVTGSIASGAGLVVQGTGYAATGYGWELLTESSSIAAQQSYNRTSSTWMTSKWYAAEHQWLCGGSTRLALESSGKINHYFNGAHSFGSTHVINQNAVGNSDGPKIAFKKLQSDTTTTTYAIGILNGVNEKSFAVTTGSDNGFGTTLMTLTNSGSVTKPLQPAFYAWMNSISVSFSSGSSLIFNATRFNIGSNFNTSTGRFTAPVAGIYLFTAALMNDPDGVIEGKYFYFSKNGSRADGRDILEAEQSTNIIHYEQHATWIAQLNVNDWVDIQSSGSGTFSNGNDGPAYRNQFSGYFLG